MKNAQVKPVKLDAVDREIIRWTLEHGTSLQPCLPCDAVDREIIRWTIEHGTKP